MKISIVQSGGYAGIDIRLADVDTSTLPHTEAQRIEQLVHDAGFFTPLKRRPSKPAPEHVGADMGVTYRISAEDAGQKHEESFVDTGSGLVESAGRHLRPLLVAMTEVGLL